MRRAVVGFTVTTLFLFSSLIWAAERPDCALPAATCVLFSTDTEFHQVWTGEDSGDLSAPSTGEAPHLHEYRNRLVATSMSVDPQHTLIRLKQYFLSRPEPALRAEATNMALAL